MILRRTLLLGAAFAGGLARADNVAPPEVAAELPGARQHGAGKLRFLGLSVYEARLWVGGGFVPAEWQRSPLLLELIYARALVGRLIAERSLDEMRRQADIGADQATRWLAAMSGTFPDVKDGDRISGSQRSDGSTRFFFNGERRGDVRDADFTRLFFGIWLAPQTSEPRLRQQLLGPGA